MINNSPNKKVNNILKLIGTSEIEKIEKYVEEVMNREFFSFTTKDQIKLFFQSYLNDFYDSIPYDDIEIIRTYTGHAYNGINSILRNYWDYEKSGTLTEETRKKIRILADDLSNILRDLPVLPINIKYIEEQI